VVQANAETFRTELVAAPRRLTFWNEIAVSTFGDIVIEPLDTEFSAQLKRVRFGALTLARASSSPARVSGARAGRAENDGWFILLNERGASRMTQRAREVSLRAGELTTLRADENYRIEFSRRNETIVLHVPGDVSSLDLDRHLARKQSVDEVPLFAALLRQIESAGVGSGARWQHLEQLTLDVAKLCWPVAAARGSRRQSMLSWERRVREHVEQNLDDPDLGAASIARRLGVTARFVHLVFARIGQSAAAFVLQRRLLAAAARLRADPAARITDVALNTGFTDLSYFSRTFRRRFGVSARVYRRAR
jgi:AraC-like DNA-binding protein